MLGRGRGRTSKGRFQGKLTPTGTPRKETKDNKKSIDD
jgi:hypothetical protein